MTICKSYDGKGYFCRLKIRKSLILLIFQFLFQNIYQSINLGREKLYPLNFNVDMYQHLYSKIIIYNITHTRSRMIIVIRNGKIVWKHGPYLAEF